MAMFEMPMIRDLTDDRDPARWEGSQEPRVADLVLLRQDQIDGLMREAEEVEGLGGVGLLFVPFARGWLGVPFCPSHDPEVTCWVLRGGQDDNPFGWTCVCEGPRQDKEIPPASGWKLPDLTVELPECRARFEYFEDGGWKLRCDRVGCVGKCRVVYAKWGKQAIAIGCTCG